MAEFNKSDHPMKTVEGKGNRFVPKNSGSEVRENDYLPKVSENDGKREKQTGETAEQALARIAKEKVPPSLGFADKVRANTKHHQKHAQDMGYKNQREYERAGCNFFNSDRGTLYYGIKRKRYYRYDEKTRELAVSSDGVLHTYLPMSNSDFKNTIKREQLYE